MSIKIMNAVWATGPKDHTGLLVLLAMADIAGDDGRLWPSVATIAEKARMSERNARRVIRALEEDGWLETTVNRGRNNTSSYRINTDRITGQDNRTNCPPGQIAPENRTNGAGKPDIAVSPEPSRTIIEPSEDTPLVPQTFSAPPKKPPRRACQIPDGWVPSERNITDALSKNFTEEETNEQADAFRDYHLSKGSVFKDWDAAWRTWLGNARKFGRASQARHPGNRSAHDGLFASFQRAALRN